MDKLLYIAASGARQISEAQAVNANNLANVNTPGFQADLTAALAKPVHGPGYDSRVYSQSRDPGVDFAKGQMISTGRALDIAVSGQGWIAVQAADGSEAYTRAGDLRISPQGTLETGRGLPVLGDDGAPIVLPEAQKIDIGQDGTISVLPLGQQANTLALVGRIKLVSPDPAQLVKGADGLLRMRDGRPAEASADVRVLSGVLESSNVSATEALMSMMALARQFETQIKLMETARENDAASARLMNING